MRNIRIPQVFTLTPMLPLCLRKDIKKAVTKFVTAFLWTSQGLNLGPPDYESVALTN